MSAYSEIDEATSQLCSAKRVLVITGAGLSSESGLPTLSETAELSAAGGSEFLTIDGFRNDPHRAWQFYHQARRAIAACKPGLAHAALVRLEALLPSFTLATHNVDGLHQVAGSRTVIELSGSIWELRCEEDGLVFTNYTTPISDQLPRCRCGGMLRPNVALSGEYLHQIPYRQLSDIITAHAKAGVAVLIGLSGRGQWMTKLGALLKAHDWSIIEVNPSSTPLSSAACITLRTSASIALPRLAENLIRPH